jgi:multiple sugar transport system substrate-binding protein
VTPGAPYRGLTWDHPRGYAPLDAAAERTASRDGHALLLWDRQPLEGFESSPIAALAGAYDLLVMDHPHVGEAVAQGCLVPLEDIFATDLIAAWDTRMVGRAMASYAWNGQHWALPLDVAAQVMASRADLLPGPVPGTWEEVVRLAERRPVALAIAGPHAVLMLLAICAALGHPPQGEKLLPTAAFVEAWRILSLLRARTPAGTAVLNPIALLDAMACSDAIALVPLVYGYVTYAVAAPGRRPISFDEAPVAVPGGPHGSVLGGTGIAVTRRAGISARLRDHLSWLLSEPAQTCFIPDHGGQPAARAAWQDDAVNARWAGFYHRTAQTAADAILRPRHDGYIAFQGRAAALIRTALQDGTDAAPVLDRLRTKWRASLAAAARPVTPTGARELP